MGAWALILHGELFHLNKVFTSELASRRWFLTFFAEFVAYTSYWGGRLCVLFDARKTHANLVDEQLKRGVNKTYRFRQGDTTKSRFYPALLIIILVRYESFRCWVFYPPEWLCELVEKNSPVNNEFRVNKNRKLHHISKYTLTCSSPWRLFWNWSLFFLIIIIN